MSVVTYGIYEISDNDCKKTWPSKHRVTKKDTGETRIMLGTDIFLFIKRQWNPCWNI